MSKISSVIIGFGMGRYHANLLRGLEDFQLAGVCDIDAERRKAAERDFNVRTYESVDDVCDDKSVELAVVATPHDTHAPLCIQLLNAGKNVVVEKVMCLNVNEAAAMIDAARKNRRLLSVFQNRRWDSDYLTVKAAVQKGILGRLIVVESSVVWHGPVGGWRAQKKHGGGMIYDWGAHLVDQCLQLMGPNYLRVFAYMTTAEWKMDVETHVQAFVQYPETLFVIEVSSNRRQPKPRWSVCGEKAQLIKQGFSPDEKATILTEVDGLKATAEMDAVKGDWADYYRNIKQVLRDGGELAVKPEESLEMVRLTQDIRYSAAVGRAVAKGEGAPA